MKTIIPTRFKPQQVEKKYQELWEKGRLYAPDLKNAANPYYNLMMFPYPSAEGLHIGNVYAFVGVDIHGRFMRMRGSDVFEPIGLDGFGIHSENYALKVNKHPMVQAKISAQNFYRQLQAIGNGFDFTRTLETYDPDYYRWTQWLFVQMFKHGLCYRAKAAVNYCPGCKTVLADEQVINQNQKSNIKNQKDEEKVKQTIFGVCERCGTEVEIKELEQWFFKITNYANKLLQNTYKQSFNWSEKVKVGQRNWIGKKEGINIKFQISDRKTVRPASPARFAESRRAGGQEDRMTIEVFTTTPVNFAATFLVLAPEHPIVSKITSIEQKDAVNKYIDAVRKMKKEDRIVKGREKTGVFTGAYVINHVTNASIPVWVSDFVLMDVGTGAIQACPGHDLRDFEFAKKFKLPIIRVVVGPDGDRSSIERPEQVIESGMPGKMINSDFLNGMEFKDAMRKTMDYFEEKGWGKRVTTYHLRDWLISRQRYWGAPIPMIYCQSCADKGLSWFTENSHPGVPTGKLNRDDRISSNQEDSIASSRFHRDSLQNDNNRWAKGWFPVAEEDLPVLLPDVSDWRPTGTGRGPLAGHPEFYNNLCPNCGGMAKRETDVCDTFLDSSWYYLRYPGVGNQKSNIKNQKDSSVIATSVATKPACAGRQSSISNKEIATPSFTSVRNDNDELPWDNETTKRWFPVDSYIGGAEHTVLHLLYTRFVWMALRDWGYLEVKQPKNQEFDPDEPFKRFFAHGLIIKDGAKMSKSKGNVVVPDEYIKLYGADTLRTYLMFLGPFGNGGDFRDTGIAGMYKWLSRVWRLVWDIASAKTGNASLDNQEAVKRLHSLIKFVTGEIENLRYNTSIAKMMEFTNWWEDNIGQIDQNIAKDFIKLLAPFAPFMTEELYSRLSVSGYQLSDSSSSDIGLSVEKTGKLKTEQQISDNRQQKTDNWSIHLQSWPEFDPELLVEDKVKIIVQVNGRMRDLLDVSISDANNQKFVEQVAKKSAKVSKWLGDKQIKQVIFVAQKLVNFVI